MTHRTRIVKQIGTILMLLALMWAAYHYLGPNLAAPKFETEAVNPDLTIDGRPVVEVFRFSNAKCLDGDSLRIQGQGVEPFEVRLASIDAPEWQQPYGEQAKQHLDDLLKRREVIAWKVGTDRYGRTLAFLFLEQQDGQLFEINSQMIRDGYAWHYRQHSTNPILDSLEYEARSARLGLWSSENLPVPPWEFRRN